MNNILFRYIYSCSCWSYVGRVGGEQEISIKNLGCAKKGIVEHEIFHALGRFHEQNRPDRRRYVTIDFKNVKKGIITILSAHKINNIKHKFNL